MFFDEGVPEGLELYLVGHEVSTVKREGWKSIKNGKLLALIENAGFEAFITNDKRMEREQQFCDRPFAVLFLTTNYWPSLEPNAAKVCRALESIQPGQVIQVECGRFVPKRFRSRQP